MSIIYLALIISANETKNVLLSNWFKRIFFGILLISLFIFVVSNGPIVLITSCLITQMLCFKEIIEIGYNHNKIKDIPYFRTLCWYFLIVANYFCLGETLMIKFESILNDYMLWKMLLNYHRFISFCLYFFGIIVFVINLKGDTHDLSQYGLLAWTHTLLIILVLQSYMVIQNCYEGIIWLVLPVLLIIINDISAFTFGRFFGKTQLIQLSPKKTWEGFVGGAFGTIVCGFILSHILCHFKYFTCPINYSKTENGTMKLNLDCTPGYLFDKGNGFFYPFGWHFLVFALFASLIAPFGGFCASGFKRAVKVKDFGTIIPGHGGIMDRFDCQFLMATFVNVYIFTFIKNVSVEEIFHEFLYMNSDSQLRLYYSLKVTLRLNNLIN